MKKHFLVILALLVLVALTAIPVHAQTITMANPGGIEERDMVVYYPNGTMQGFYNSTSVITLDGTLDYIFTMKPVGGNPLSDPRAFLSSGFTFVSANVLPIIVIVFLSILFLGR